MSTIAIIGAGPNLGAAVARRFGAEGFAVALISRDQAKLDDLAAGLRADGVTAVGFAADVRDPSSLRSALGNADGELGEISVLQYSPLPSRDYLRPVLETTPEQLREAVDFSVHGAYAAVLSVLPAMRRAGRGSLLFVNGGTSVRPRAGYAGTSVAFAGESALVAMLHETLAPEGIHAAQLVVPGAIAEDGVDEIAVKLWHMHTSPTDWRILNTPLDT